MQDETIQVAVAVGEEHTAGWIELTLAATPGVRVVLVRGDVLHGARPFAILVVDGDDPGPDFLNFYRRLRLVQPDLWLLALGGEDAPVLRAVEWDADRTILLPKPFRLDEVRDAFGWLRERMATEGTKVGATSEVAAAPVTAVHPADLLQMLCINRWTGKVEWVAPGTGRRGAWFLDAGQVVHAEAAAQEGEAACRLILRWGAGEFSTHAEVRPPRRTIERPWEQVLVGEDAREPV